MEEMPAKKVQNCESQPESAAAHGNFLQHIGVDYRAPVKGKSHVEEIQEPESKNELPAVKASFRGHICIYPWPDGHANTTSLYKRKSLENIRFLRIGKTRRITNAKRLA
jgi:hypothetical protein